ncbi:hypothetical protein Aperf_G00000062316 [Anoplocephala perfoliata]
MNASQWHATTKTGSKNEFQGGLQDALSIAGLTFRGRPHSGIDDARSQLQIEFGMISPLIWTLIDTYNNRKAQNSSAIIDNFVRNKENFSDEELRAFSVELLNAFLLKDTSSDCVKILDNLVVDTNTYFSLVENLPIIQLFFDPNIMGLLDNKSVSALQELFSKFLDHITLRQLLGEIVSHLIFKRFLPILDWYSSSSKVKHDKFSICFHSIVLVSFIRLVDKIVTCQGNSANPVKISDSSRLPSDELVDIYQRSFESLSDSVAEDSKFMVNNLESFISDTFNFLSRFCAFYENVALKEPTFEEFVPKFKNDPKLENRLRLGYALYLARACRFLNLLLESRAIFSSSQCFPGSDLQRVQKFVHALLATSGQIPDQFSHADLVAWNVDHGLCVKDYALAFLGNSMFEDALCSSKVIPRLIRQISFLTSDSDVTMAVICKLNHLRCEKLPTNHHEELLKELMSVLSPDIKSHILDLLHNKSENLLTPLPSDENKFRSYMRTFYNRLSAGPEVSASQPVSKIGKLWRSTLSSSSVSKEILLSADLLLLTRPVDFLVELVRFPIVQNSMTLFPVVYKILNHVSYAFDIDINEKKMPILQNLMILLLSIFDSEISEGRENDDGQIWRGESRQRIALMRYLPRSGDLDPTQISLATQAAKFSMSTVGSTVLDLADDDDEGGGNDDSISKSGLRKLWVCAIACLLDRPATWPHLSDFVNDESSVLTTRVRAELFTQSLALLLLPRPPPDVPVDLAAPPCLRLLERLRTPLAVHLCTALFSSTSGEVEQLRNVLIRPDDQGRHLFFQSIDFLPGNLMENTTIYLPRCLTQSRLVDVTALNGSAKNRFKFTSNSSQTSTRLIGFARSLSASDFEEVLQLVTLCDSIWHIVVNHILTMATQTPAILSVWSDISASTLVLALYIFLHRIAKLDETDAIECWARAMGFLDQLVSGGLINMPFHLRSADSEISQSQNIYLGNYRGSLDLFDFIFALLRLADISTRGSVGSQILVGRLCQTLAALGQRLITRLRDDLHESGHNSETEVLTQQAILLFAEVKTYVETHDTQTNSPLKRLITSLNIVENVLTRQREDQENKRDDEKKENDEENGIPED